MSHPLRDRDMQRVQSTPRVHAKGLGLLSKCVERITTEKNLNETKLYWTLFFAQESLFLESLQLGDFIASDRFTLHRSDDEAEQQRLRDPTEWRFRLYPVGAPGTGWGVCLYLENLNAQFYEVSFSVDVLKVNERNTAEFHVGFEKTKVRSHNHNKAFGVNLGSFRQIMETLKRRNHQANDCITLVLEINLKLNIPTV